MVSLKDVSKKCGYSVATVSKTINHHADISDETKQKVLNAIKELGYSPNYTARALRTKHNNSIGIVYNTENSLGLAHNHYSKILSSLRSTLEKKGYEMTFINHSNTNENTNYYSYCRSRNFDGICIVNVSKFSDKLMPLIESKMPIVIIDYKFNEHTAIISDNIIGIKKLVEYAYEMGHRKIAFIHGGMSFVTDCRIRGFYKTMEKLSLEIPKEYIIEGIYTDVIDTAKKTNYLLYLKNKPTCIIFPDDYAVIGGINAIRNKGLSVPNDISVCGYDGSYISQIFSPKITTYKQDCKQIGDIAASNLISLIAKPKTTLIETFTIEGKLWKGETVANIN